MAIKRIYLVMSNHGSECYPIEAWDSEEGARASQADLNSRATDFYYTVESKALMHKKFQEVSA